MDEKALQLLDELIGTAMGGESPYSVLDDLFTRVTEGDILINDATMEGFHQLTDTLNHLNTEEQEIVMNLASDLSLEHARIAFREGIYVGVKLLTELAK